MEIKNEIKLKPMFLKFEESFQADFKSITAKNGLSMIDAFRGFMHCFIKHPKKCLQLLELVK